MAHGRVNAQLQRLHRHAHVGGVHQDDRVTYRRRRLDTWQRPGRRNRRRGIARPVTGVHRCQDPLPLLFRRKQPDHGRLLHRGRMALSDAQPGQLRRIRRGRPERSIGWLVGRATDDAAPPREHKAGEQHQQNGGNGKTRVHGYRDMANRAPALPYYTRDRRRPALAAALTACIRPLASLHVKRGYWKLGSDARSVNGRKQGIAAWPR